jgi:hypothetical protein
MDPGGQPRGPVGRGVAACVIGRGSGPVPVDEGVRLGGRISARA